MTTTKSTRAPKPVHAGQLTTTAKQHTDYTEQTPCRTGRSRRTGLLAVLVATIALVATACGSADKPSESVASVPAGTTSASPAPKSGATPDGVAFANCMRTHGLPAFKDPEPGKGMGEGVDVNSAEFTKAMAACKDLMPAGDPGANPGQVWSAADKLKYAQCMRENGVPDFPDPSADGGFVLQNDPNTPQFKTAEAACAKYQPESMRNMTPGKQGGPAAGGGS